MNFQSLEEMVAASFEAMRPAERLTVTEAAERYHIIRSAGSHSGPWSKAKTPYLVEPQDVLTSLEYTGMIFVGPARTGKSAMLLNWLASTAKLDPVDMMVVHMAQHTAREWSKADLSRFMRHSHDIRALLVPGKKDDSIFDKSFISGMRLTVTWPTINNLSGKTIPRNWIMDYDRIADDIDKEGNAFDLTKKRAQTFKRFGMTVAESSPGREIENPKWMKKTPHEAPPTKGILELYNRGDRRRWYWKCPQCYEAFEPSFSLLEYPESEDFMESAEQVVMICPECGNWMKPDQQQELNAKGRWVKDGMIWLTSGEMVERPGMKVSRSDIASFWMKGPAAGFQTWGELVINYLRGQAAYDASGDEQPLRSTVTLDQGEPYISKARISERLPEELKAKAEEWGATKDRPTVPSGVRFLVATVDVQARAFVVQVAGFTEASDMVIIDGFKIWKSERVDDQGDKLPIDPAAFGEDWDLLVPQVIKRAYELGDGSGRVMEIRAVGCDSGGRDGVTANAYGFWRRLRNTGDDPLGWGIGLHKRFALVKGDATKSAPRVVVSWPDAAKKDKLAGPRGDVPVLRLQSDLLKDQIAGMLARRVADSTTIGGGSGMIRFPKWMPDWLYTQLTTENRTTKGWINPSKRRNEAWDLAYYALGLVLRGRDNTCPLVTFALDRIDFENDCPGWAEDWDGNDLVRKVDEPAAFTKPRPKFDLAALGAELA